MTNLKHIEWHGGASAHQHHQRPRPSQRDLVAASLLRSGAAPPRRRWDERTQLGYSDRGR
jgi:hypothetical protein